jgi:heme exporter protein A
VFAGVSFVLEPGEALLLRGPNGSGKSSLLRMLAAFLRPAAGELAWQGVPVAHDLAQHRRQLCYLGHADAVKGGLTVRENLLFALALQRGRPGPDPIAAALERFDLTALGDTPGRHLSAGQRRRVALARLLTDRRLLWLLDEPGVGLDAASRARLEDVIAAHRERGGMVALAGHGDTTVGDAKVLELGG